MILHGWGSLTSGWTLEPEFLGAGVLEAGALVPVPGASGLTLIDEALAILLAVETGTYLPVIGLTGWAWGLALGPATAAWYLTAWWGVAAATAATMGGLMSTLSIVALLWVQLLESCDVFLVAGELALVGAVLAGFLHLTQRLGVRTPAYADVVTFCQQRGVSVAEVFGLVTFLGGFLCFDAFVTMAEDDALEALSYVFAGVICLAVVLLSLAVDVQYYYMVSSISGAEPTLRLLYTDFVNNALCLLRIVFCWVRYLFYDLQAELVDFAFHYTEFPEEGLLGGGRWGDAAPGWAGWAGLSGALLVVFGDGVSLLLQLLLGAFKLALALYLFWLILDLFLLRTLARTEARWGALCAHRQR